MKPLLLSALLSALIAAPAVAGPFSALGGDHPVRAPSVSAPVAITLDGLSDAVLGRVDVAMAAEGFERTEPAKSKPNEIGYTRLVDIAAFRDAADCSGLGIGSPKLWIETVIFGADPVAGGVRLTPRGEFKVLLSGLVSGKPFTLACRSRGVIEDQVVKALKAS